MQIELTPQLTPELSPNGCAFLTGKSGVFPRFRSREQERPWGRFTARKKERENRERKQKAAPLRSIARL
jgi:hypothetical protein